MPDFDDVRDAVRRADLGALERLLAAGWGVNAAEMVDLRHGNDGYFAYGKRRLHSGRHR